MSSPGVEPGLRPSQSRVPSVTLRGRCRDPKTIPRPGIGPGLAASKAAVRPPHSRGNWHSSPRQESNLVYDLRRVACSPSHSEGCGVVGQADGRTRTGILLFRRQGPLHSATSAVGLLVQQGCKESNPVHPGWSRRPLPGGHPCHPAPDEAGAVVRSCDQAIACAGSSARNPFQLSTRAPGRRRAASSRVGPGASGAASRPARGSGRPCGRCSRRRRRRSWSSSTRRPASGAGRGRWSLAPSRAGPRSTGRCGGRASPRCGG